MIWIIGIGGSVGAAARYFLGEWIIAHLKEGTSFPFGTWIINILGSVFLGFLANGYVNGQLSEWIWYLIGVGFCGAFTTFSTFGYETIRLIHKGRIVIAVQYVSLSVLVGIGAAFVGFNL